MATTTPSSPPTSPHEEVENDNRQPPIAGSPPKASVLSPPSPLEDVDRHHRQFTNSSSPYSPPQLPENSVDRQQHPSTEDRPVPPSPPPEENNSDRQQLLALPSLPSLIPPSPPPTDGEHPSENQSPNHESPLSKQPPSSQSPELEDLVESPNYRLNPNPNSDHEFRSPSLPAELQRNPNPKTRQSSPHDTLEPNTYLTPSLGVPNKPQISPWTHQETANLILAYQEKWYSLKKGPLKAGQWEEVAITVAIRCGYEDPTKTAKQCRHKIEKLRKRYRSERGKPRSKATAWNFFKLMDNLEKGPLPISSSEPMALVEYQKPSNSNAKKRENDEFLVNKRSSRFKNSNHGIINGGLAQNLRFSDGGNGVVRGLRTPVVHKHKGFYREDDGREEEEKNCENDGEDDDVAAQLAVEIKGFAEKFVKMEKNKIEMMRDVERYRLEMENKKMEMIIESRQMLVETVNKAFGSSHKTHKTQMMNMWIQYIVLHHEASHMKLLGKQITLQCPLKLLSSIVTE